MTAPTTEAYGARLVGEFEDDASGFLDQPPEYVSDAASALNHFPPAVAFAVSRATAAVAKKFYLRILRRFMEPVPGKRGRYRVASADEPSRGRVAIEWRVGSPAGHPFYRYTAGSEVDTSDPLYLTLFAHAKPTPAESAELVVCDFVFPIPWGEIVSIHFDIQRPAVPELKPGANGTS